MVMRKPSVGILALVQDQDSGQVLAEGKLHTAGGTFDFQESLTPDELAEVKVLAKKIQDRILADMVQLFKEGYAHGDS